MTPEQRHREGVFTRHADEHGHVRCIQAGGGPCGGRLQAHHCVERQRIRNKRSDALIRLANGEEISHAHRRLVGTELAELIADDRNGVPVCEIHHSRAWAIPVPDSAYEFAEDYGLLSSLPERVPA